VNSQAPGLSKSDFYSRNLKLIRLAQQANLATNLKFVSAKYKVCKATGRYQSDFLVPFTTISFEAQSIKK
jgi:hypothetical protein